MKIFLLLFLAASAAFAQPKFDAASVKPNLLDDHIVAIDPGPGGRFSARGYTLKLLIQYAYDVKGWQISGGTGWLDTDRYDVTARSAADATPAQLRQMLQALLADRFALRVHRTQREMAGFELSVSNGGVKMPVSAAKDENPNMTRDKNHALAASGISMASFAKVVGAYVSKPVADRTGLSGLYDVRLLWSERADQVPDDSASAEPGVSLISALRDQLGLKLAAKRVPAEIILIDGAEKASAN